MMRKQYLVIEIYKKIESIVKLSVFSHFLAKSSNFEVNTQIVCLFMMTSSVVTSPS